MQIRNLNIGEGRTKICVPIVERTKEAVCEKAKEMLVPEVDFIEWRLDYLDAVMEKEQVLEMAAALRTVVTDKPILATFRTKAEGGEKEIDISYYEELLLALAESGNIDLVDVEAYREGEEAEKKLMENLQKFVPVIASYHDFSKTPSEEEMIERLCYMDRIGASIPKLAVMPQNKEDVYRLMVATKKAKENIQKPIITMSMASDGVISRILGEYFGSSVTFGCIGKSSAPGQVEVTKLSQMLQSLHEIL